MIKNQVIFLKHILESIEAIESYSKNISMKELNTNRMKKNAIIREIEIIGEATKNISLEIKKNYPEVEWTKIAGSRDKLIHHYFGIDLGILIYIIKEDLPILKKQIQQIIIEVEENGKN
jgi:uncharacterized protein with HEPN domain